MKKLMIISTMVLAFLTFTKNASGQCMNYNWTNNSGCDWDITFYDNMGTAIAASKATAPALSGTGTVPPGGNCFACGANMNGGRVDFVNVCGCTISISLLSGGTVTTVVNDCANQGCGTINCSTSPTTSSISVVRTIPPGGIPCANTYIITIN